MLTQGPTETYEALIEGRDKILITTSIYNRGAGAASILTDQPDEMCTSVKVSRKDALVAVRTVSGLLGLSDDELLLLEFLIEVSSARDWATGQLRSERLAYEHLEAVLALDRTMVDRNLGRLATARLIRVAHDIPTPCHEMASILADEVLIDLSPLAARVGEMEWLAEAEKLNLLKQVKAESGQHGFRDRISYLFDALSFEDAQALIPDLQVDVVSDMQESITAASKRGPLSSALHSFFGFWSGHTAAENAQKSDAPTSDDLLYPPTEGAVRWEQVDPRDEQPFVDFSPNIDHGSPSDSQDLQAFLSDINHLAFLADEIDIKPASLNQPLLQYAPVHTPSPAVGLLVSTAKAKNWISAAPEFLVRPKESRAKGKSKRNLLHGMPPINWMIYLGRRAGNTVSL